MKIKTRRKESLQEIISEKYDNEIDIYRLITFEAILLKSKMLNEYTQKLNQNYSKISFSITKTKEKIGKVFES